MGKKFSSGLPRLRRQRVPRVWPNSHGAFPTPVLRLSPPRKPISPQRHYRSDFTMLGNFVKVPGEPVIGSDKRRSRFPQYSRSGTNNF